MPLPRCQANAISAAPRTLRACAPAGRHGRALCSVECPHAAMHTSVNGLESTSYVGLGKAPMKDRRPPRMCTAAHAARGGNVRRCTCAFARAGATVDTSLTFPLSVPGPFYSSALRQTCPCGAPRPSAGRRPPGSGAVSRRPPAASPPRPRQPVSEPARSRACARARRCARARAALAAGGPHVVRPGPPRRAGAAAAPGAGARRRAPGAATPFCHHALGSRAAAECLRQACRMCTDQAGAAIR